MGSGSFLLRSRRAAVAMIRTIRRLILRSKPRHGEKHNSSDEAKEEEYSHVAVEVLGILLPSPFECLRKRQPHHWLSSAHLPKHRHDFSEHRERLLLGNEEGLHRRMLGL